MKKIISFMLTLVMILSLSIPVFASITSTEDGSNAASKKVKAYYTPSDPSAEASITGIGLKVDSVGVSANSLDEPAEIFSDSTVEIELYLSNADKLLTKDKSKLSFNYFGGNNKEIVASDSDFWDLYPDYGLVSHTYTAEEFSRLWSNLTEAKQLFYSNDGINSIGSGIFVISNTEKRPVTKITGVSIVVKNGDETVSPDADGVYHINASSLVTLTVTGENLKYATPNQYVAAGYAYSLDTAFSFDEDGTSGSTSPIAGTNFESCFNVFEIEYYNNGWAGECIKSGIKIIYDTGIAREDWAKIKKVTVKVGDKTYTADENNHAHVFLTPDSGDVTITVSGENFQNLGIWNQLEHAQGYVIWVLEDYGWEIDTEKHTASTKVSYAEFDEFKNFEIKYTNDGEHYEGSGVYISYVMDPVSVDLTWGAMSFVYSAEKTDGVEKGWTCAEGANVITAENKGDTVVKAELSYSSYDKYKAITGACTPASADIQKNASANFSLTLNGKSTASVDNEVIGTVTVALSKSES